MGIADEVAPSFTQKPSLRQEDDGNKLLFECQLLANPRPDVVWFRGDTELINSSRTKIYINEISSAKYKIVLEINDVIETDAGLYKVVAKNKLGEVSASINLNFTAPDEPRPKQIDGIAPTFAQKPTIKQEDDGKRLLFECRILADPAPTITWCHNNDIVKDSGRYQIIIQRDGNSYYSVLEIDDVTVEDAGKYKVTAKNDLGESNATISLNFDSEDVPKVTGIKPTFTQKPLIRQSDDFSKIIFECRLASDPAPKLFWYHGERLLKEGGRFNMLLQQEKNAYCAILEIGDVSGEDGGEYKVIAKNDVGEGTATINLSFEGNQDAKPKIPDGKAPRFPQKPTIRQQGEILIMECILEANPFPEISWYHGTILLKEGGRHKMMVKTIKKDLYSLTLEIRDPKASDGGAYKCSARNDLGESNANIALNFQGAEEPKGFAPTFIEKPKIIPKEEGTLIVLECRVRAKPQPEVTWYRGSTLIKESTRIKTRTIPDSDTYTLTLEIRDPLTEDGGSYKCTVKNEFGESNANLTLNFQGEEEPKRPEGFAPTFLEKPKIIPSADNKIISMECKVRAKPKPEVVWYFGNEVVKQGGRYNIIIKAEGDTYTITLQIRDPVPKDGGIYKCNVKNDLGESNANLTLNFEEPPKPEGLAPSFLEKPKIVQDGQTIRIECKLQAKPKPDIFWYHGTILVKETSRIKIRIRQEVDIYHITLEIYNFGMEDGGMYRVTAKNTIGEANANINLNLESPPPGPPVIVDKPIVKRIDKGRRIIIELHLVAKKEPQIQWFYGSRVIRSEGRFRSWVRQVNQISGEYMSYLEITEPTNLDKGTYKIIAKGDEGETSETVEVSFEDIIEDEPKPKGEAPTFIQQLKSIIVTEGQTAEFICKVKGTSLEITWFKNKKVVKSSRDVEITFDGSVARLFIRKCTTEHAGRYSVEIVNDFGEAVSTADLIVKDAEKKKIEEEEKQTDQQKIEEKTEEKIEEIKIEEKKPEEKKPEEKKPEEKKPEEKKPEEKKLEEIKPEEEKPEIKKVEEPKPETKKLEEQKVESIKLEEKKLEEKKIEEKKSEEIKHEEKKPDEKPVEKIKPEDKKPDETKIDEKKFGEKTEIRLEPQSVKKEPEEMKKELDVGITALTKHETELEQSTFEKISELTHKTEKTELAKLESEKIIEQSLQVTEKKAELVKQKEEIILESVKKEQEKILEPIKKEPEKVSEPIKKEPEKSLEPEKKESEKIPESFVKEIEKKAEPEKIPVPITKEPEKDLLDKKESEKFTEPSKKEPEKISEFNKKETELLIEPKKKEPEKISELSKPEPEKISEPSKKEPETKLELTKKEVEEIPEISKKESEKVPEFIKKEPEKIPEPIKKEPEKISEPIKKELEKVPEVSKKEIEKVPEPRKREPEKKIEPSKKEPEKIPEPSKKEPEEVPEPSKKEPEKVPEPRKREPEKKLEPSKKELEKVPEPIQKEPEKKLEPSKKEPEKVPEPSKKELETVMVIQGL